MDAPSKHSERKSDPQTKGPPSQVTWASLPDSSSGTFVPPHSSMFEMVQSMPADTKISDFVQVSAEDFNLIQAQLANSHKQHQNAKNLVQIIQEKDEDICRLQDRAQEYERALRVTELKFGQLVRSQLEESKGTNYASMKTTSVKRDGYRNSKSLNDADTKHKDGDRLETDEETSTSVDFNANMVSRKLFDRVVEENKKIKKSLERLVQKSQYGSISKFLDANETEDLICDLREELKKSKQNEKKLQEILTLSKNSDISELAAKCANLQATVQRLESAFGNKSALAETYRTALEKTHAPRPSHSQAKADDKTDFKPPTDDLQKKKERIVELEKEVSRLNGSSEKLSKTMEVLVASNKEEKQNLLKKVSSLEKQVEVLQAQNDTCEDEARKNQHQMSVMREEHEKVLGQHKLVIHRQLQQMRKLQEELNKTHDLYKREITSLKKKQSWEITQTCSRSVMQRNPIGMDDSEIACDGPMSVEFPPGGGAKPKTQKEYTCERCWKKFGLDKKKYEDHRTLCNDDDDDD